MELGLAISFVIYCLTVNSGWCMDQDTQLLVDHLERSTATDFTVAYGIVFHIEIDFYRPGHILYTDNHSLKTSNGTTTTTIAGNTTENGYREGRGSQARFSLITGFAQITDERVVVVDNRNQCLREINRLTGVTSVFSGQCGSSGYTDGHRSQSQFRFPWSVIKDNNDDRQLLVADYSNWAVRTVGINHGDVGTFVKSDILQYPIYLTQDDKGDLYVIAEIHALYRITYREKIIKLISGSPGNSAHGYTDSSLPDSLFHLPFGLVFIGHQTLLLADTSNDNIRLVDLDTNRVSTLDLWSSYPHLIMSHPWSLLITNDSLYVGQSGRIRKFIYSTLTTTPTTTTTTQTTTTHGATARTPCQNRNMTLYVTSDEERALVYISADYQTAFAVGSHVIYRDTCTMNILVINNGTTSKAEECPEVIRAVVSASTGLSALDLTLDGTVHQLELPVGVYNYHIYRENGNCSLKVEIKDYLLLRRIELVAEYDIKCTVLTDKVAFTTLTSLANSNSNQIKEICQHNCSPQAGSQAKLSCDNDTLTVTWSTDVKFDGTITEIPVGLKQKLTDKLLEQSRYPILTMLVITRIPPVVYPAKTKTGAYAELVLTSSCLPNKKYDKRTDSCV